ncbi:hypothetical protein [Bythopirellula polymerisocia]|uniref:IncA protein n=1 Tax=Bythopirellula polymerisocia TaxID=2528003 RepID=A0A5C6CB94_9BACT|nr:hypothetical protein [Bythopirellula polymerisocia]TWU21900.1 hypothetical protein Pla144_43350 [Bythopirellula polymerisocia]
MSNRSVSENSDSISLFPFLAVLLCTMGALLVLLVVLVQRATREGLVAQMSQLTLISETQPTAENHDQTKQLQEELAEVAAYQQQLANLRDEANKRLETEQLRLSHSEEHARRLEEELARLAIAAAQLKQTEENQSVDQEQAEREVARLEKLVADTQQQVEELRAQSGGKHSFAIVPYKGPNGTYRRPIYIECSSEGITLHPEGVRLTADDFIAPNWPGNPLAAALRASREYLNNKAAKGGDYAPPDPYPLMIIRPDGIKQYALARAAITSWDSDYGYEFIDEDMKLTFPEAADPQLARAQQHAVIIARDRLLQLAQAAPSRFRGMGLGGGMTSASGDGDVPGGRGYGSTGSTSNDSDRYLAGNQDGEGGSENSGNTRGQTDSNQQRRPGELQGQEGDLAGTPGTPNPDGASASADGEASGSEGNSEGGSSQQVSTDKNLVGSRYSQQSTGEPGSAGGSSKQANSNAPNQQASGASSGGASQQSSSDGTPTMSFSNKPSESIAASKGANWAVERANQHSVPIRRSIRVVVRENQMAILPTKNASRGKEFTGQIISLDQPVDKISQEFVAALRDRIEEWGLAGSGMYWRPVLELNVGPDAQLTATRVANLLQDSGVDLQLPETAENPVTPTPREGVLR